MPFDESQIYLKLQQSQASQFSRAAFEKTGKEVLSGALLLFCTLDMLRPRRLLESNISTKLWPDSSKPKLKNMSSPLLSLLIWLGSIRRHISEPPFGLGRN